MKQFWKFIKLAAGAMALGILTWIFRGVFLMVFLPLVVIVIVILVIMERRESK